MTEKEISAKFSQEHANLLSLMKNDLLIVLFRKLGAGDKNGPPIYISTAELDSVRGIGLAFEITPDKLGFNFKVIESGEGGKT